MHLTASERATLNFYQWERLGRGYDLFSEPIGIEPPYIPFVHRSYNNHPPIDDGRIPTLFDLGKKFLLGKKKEPQYEEGFPTIEPNPARTEVVRVGFAVYLPKDTEISSVVSGEFLNMLSFTSDPVSFELLGTKEAITIQLICSKEDSGRVESHLNAYFPTAIIRELESSWFPFDTDKFVAIADFGLNDEFMRPLNTVTNFNVDPLTSVIATMNSLQDGDMVLFQTIFKGVTAPWARDVQKSVSDGRGGSFFADAPEMTTLAKDKVSSPLFAVVMRVATQSNSEERSQYLATEMIRSITSASTGQYNKLIPLSNEGYNYHNHLYNVLVRQSNRFGMILNTAELSTFVHYPNRTVVSEKLGLQGGKTKAMPSDNIAKQYAIGVNIHNGIESTVTLDDEQRLRHTHLIGATGVGKSTLITNMVLEDIRHGNGVAVFDPHGDLCDAIAERVPEERLQDVVLIDPSDIEFPIGFNLLSAVTDSEAIVLGSDLVSSFRRSSTSWGDNINAVLSNAINTFLESSEGGTLIELKRFLLEEKFRNEFLTKVDDPSIHYYWEHEYPMVRKGIAPLLTRIDTFLRPKIVRYMLAQKSGVDFRECIEQKKIVLIKLSQGLIGEENSYLLGSLFLSKFNQVAQSRQNLSKEQRHPYYLYLDEFQNFITPSITSILSGARKYGLGLILAHQDLTQIDDAKTLNSVISNPHVRVCFRLGDVDARKLESGFSSFEETDLQSLGIGQAVMRVGSSTNDFNVLTHQLPKIDPRLAEATKGSIIQNTRRNYAKPQAEIQKILDELLPKPKQKKKQLAVKEEDRTIANIPVIHQEIIPEPETPDIQKEHSQSPSPTNTLEDKKEAFLEEIAMREAVTKHRSLQNHIRAMAQQRGYVVKMEEPTPDGGRVDLALTKDQERIAVEISVTNSLEYELHNIVKCIEAGYPKVYMVSENKTHLSNIKKLAKESLPKEAFRMVGFLSPNELMASFDDKPKKADRTKRILGYRVKSRHKNPNPNEVGEKGDTLKNIILKPTKKKKP